MLCSQLVEIGGGRSVAKYFVKQDSHGDRAEDGEGVEFRVAWPDLATPLSIGDHARQQGEHPCDQLVVPYGCEVRKGAALLDAIQAILAS